MELSKRTLKAVFGRKPVELTGGYRRTLWAAIGASQSHLTSGL